MLEIGGVLEILKLKTASVIERLRAFARRIKRDLRVWRLVLKDARTPWYAKALLWFGIGYALMPFDIVPDFIPVLGFLDDVVLVGVPIALAIKLVPAQVIADCRREASA